MGEVLTLSYKQTEALIRLMHDIDDDRAPALFARFKYLQRMDYPNRPSVGRGSRVGYRFEEVMQLVMVFQLMEVGLAPLRIVRTLRTCWPNVSHTLSRADRFVRAIESGTAQGDDLDELLLVITPAALLELGMDESVDTPVIDELAADYRDMLELWLKPEHWVFGIPEEGPIPIDQRECCKIVVDPARLVSLVRSVLVDRLGQSQDEVKAAFAALARDADSLGDARYDPDNAEASGRGPSSIIRR